jgi:hypothetical protein
MEATDSDVRYAQVAVQEITAILLSLADRLETIASGIEQPPNLDAMVDGELPLTVAVDLRGAIECTLLDDLRPAVERLSRAARATPEGLLRDFLDQRDGGPVRFRAGGAGKEGA